MPHSQQPMDTGQQIESEAHSRRGQSHPFDGVVDIIYSRGVGELRRKSVSNADNDDL